MALSSRFAPLLLVLLAGAGSTVAIPSAAHDAPTAQGKVDIGPLLSRLGSYALRFEQMEKRGSFLLKGRMDELDTSGGVDGTKELVLRVTATPGERVTEILKYIEDGEDKTGEARAKQAKAKSEKPDAKKKFRLPFHPLEQQRYAFTLVERDARSRGRVRVAFKPFERAETAFAGSAWVDEASGEVLTLGFSPTKTPLFIDHVDIKMLFDNATSLGRAPSSVWFEARGGLLIIKKHYLGTVTLTDAKISF